MSSMYGARGAPAGTTAGMGGGAPKGYDKVSNFSPEQQQLFQSMFGHLGQGSYLSRLAGGDESLFSEMEAPALRQFSGMQGNIASRFSGMGMGARRSSGFQNTMNQASSDFAQDLQSKRQGLQQQAIKDLLGMGNHLLGQQPFSYMEKSKPFWQEFLSSMGGGLGQGIGMLPGLFL